MRVAFAGTPEFAAVALAAIAAAGHDIVLVLTRPDRPAGRGLHEQASAVKRLAGARGYPVAQPASLREPAAQAPLARAGADVLVVAAYGLILPQAVLDLPRLGALNIHASLLPRWRGAAPIQRALLAGDAETGITLMRMDAGLDTGPMLCAQSLPIGPADTAGSLHDRLAELGARLAVEALPALAAGRLAARPQPAEGVSYAAKIAKHEAEIDWRRPAADIDRQVRAFDPSPGAVARLGGVAVKLWRARPEPAAAAPPGTLVAAERDGIVVACGTGALRVTELQKAGGRRLAAADFLAGARLAAGERFDLPAA